MADRIILIIFGIQDMKAVIDRKVPLYKYR